MAKILSVVSFKGGVGKTTVAVNVAACMAHDLGKKVLVADLDPQSNTSLWLMGPQSWSELSGKNPMDSVYGLMHSVRKVEDILIRPYGDERPPEQRIENLYLLPAVTAMMDLEVKIVRAVNAATIHGLYKPHQEHILLKKALRDHVFKNDYDIVILDCPPNLYSVTKNALLYSDYYVAPAIPDMLSTYGMRTLMEQVEDLARALIRFKRRMTPVLLLGVILNRYQGLNINAAAISRLEATFQGIKAKEMITVGEESEVFEDYPIRRYKAHQEAVRAALPMTLYKDAGAGFVGNAYEDVLALTKRIGEKMGLTDSEDSGLDGEETAQTSDDGASVV